MISDPPGTELALLALLFDDFTERMASPDMTEQPVYLYLGGEAGTGKSYLVKLLIEAVKILNIKAGNACSARAAAVTGSQVQGTAYIII